MCGAEKVNIRRPQTRRRSQVHHVELQKRLLASSRNALRHSLEKLTTDEAQSWKLLTSEPSGAETWSQWYVR